MSRYLGAGLGAGDAVLAIVTRSHRESLEGALCARGLDLERAAAEGRYVALDAERTLGRLCPGDRLDASAFEEIVEGAVARALDEHGAVRAFGEMVALLALQGRPELALELEQRWSRCVRERPFSLLCAYPLSAFAAEPGGHWLVHICGEHSHVAPAESFDQLHAREEELRAVAVFQQKVASLEAELAERRLRGRSAEEAQARLAAIVESSDDAIVSKTLEGIVTSWNDAAQRLFGYAAAEIVGQPITRLAPPERRAEMSSILERIRRGERLEHFETERVRKDGTLIHVSVTISPIRDADGRVIGASKIARNVTERRRTEAAKDEFLAMLGHELRKPLAAVQSAISAAGLDDARRAHALEIARRQAAQLRKLIDDLLDVTRVTHGKIGLRKQRLRLAVVVGRAVEATRVLVEERGHALVLAVDPELEVDADAGRLEQVVVNVLVNAAKYTPPGGRIELHAERSGDEIRLRVRDNGIGIHPEALPHVFELFAQDEKSLDRAQGGLGIGLALVRRIAELHGGRAEARSPGPGRGAEFAIRLPAARGAEPELAPPGFRRDMRPIARVRVLLVEDNVDAADSLAMVLELLGQSVEIAYDGISALEALQRNPPDLMLVDIGLPGIDGFEVARRVRAGPGGRDLLLVALTGYGREQDRARTRAVGFDEHLTKPVETETLREIIARAASGA